MEEIFAALGLATWRASANKRARPTPAATRAQLPCGRRQSRVHDGQHGARRQNDLKGHGRTRQPVEI
eukprot:4927404-Lingulodinium_polyedra.AAC.1